MALAWFICPYQRIASSTLRFPARQMALCVYTAEIYADGGDAVETEVLGNVALVKVRASAATLDLINALPGVVRIPNHVALTDTLGDLTTAQRNAILNKLQAMGYTQQEINAALPANWQSVTLGQVLRFAARRRLQERYDAGTDTIVCDGPALTPRPVDDVDAKVS